MIFEMNFVKVCPEIPTPTGNCLLLVIVLLCGLLLVLRYLSKGNFNLPPGPVGLPLVGYTPFLGKKPFKTLDILCQKYGNVFSLYLGRTYIVVLGDYTAVKEAFSKSATNNRPSQIFDCVPDGVGVTEVNGEEWIQDRRLVLTTMKDVGLGRSTWEYLVEDCVSDFVKLIASQKGHPVDIEKFLMNSITECIASLTFGKRLPEGPDKELIYSASKTMMRVCSPSGFRSFFPTLCNLLVALKITSYYKDYCELAAFNDFVRKEVNLHQKCQAHSQQSGFISDYITCMQNNEGKIKERNIIGNSIGLLVAGSETTRTTLVWLFLVMAAFPEVQENVHSELNSVLGKEKRATWEDRLKLPYTYAVILETQRWTTVVPFNLPRMTSENISVCGYDIPKGTTIYVNFWGLHNDSRYWKEPEKFIPERFLEDGVNAVNVKKESFVPFSYGKRKCLGENVAMIQVFLYFTAVMSLFNVRVPGGGKPNMEATLGLSYKPVSQHLCFVPRKEDFEMLEK